jgi:hypothetical protein
LKESDTDIKIYVKKRYVVNGKEYHSLEEMPADIRQVYETAIASKGVTRPSSAECGVSRKINFNGRVYSSPDELPADARELYEKAQSISRLGVSEIVTSQKSVTTSIAPGEPTRSTGSGGLKRFLSLIGNIAYYISIIYFLTGGYINIAVFLSLVLLNIIFLIFIKKNT